MVYFPIYFRVDEKQLREVPLEDEVLGGVGEGLDHDEADLEDNTLMMMMMTRMLLTWVSWG